MGEWTKEPPAKPGWYWLAGSSFHMTPAEVRIIRDADGDHHEHRHATPDPWDRYINPAWWWWSTRLEKPPVPSAESPTTPATERRRET